MIETEASVLSVEHDGAHAWVETRPHGSCGACAGSGGCHSVSISRLFSVGRQHYRVANPVGAQAGDKVIVAVAERALLHGSLLMYLVPVAALFAGASLGALAGETASVVAGAAAFAVSLLIIRRLATRYAGRADYQPAIVRRRAACAGGHCSGHNKT
ncbi:SoxR reducing system RseC family protein [Microvirgula aerodenitrificans]|uniref:SoxR reducing system RseC family protein n=1 Tax=Microvirgula aerodenitrificans TaxID=57480 RepID=UPI00248E4081|nr:SoxR reducing system RseC family protein [Microvirgula aerodenitrificans]